MSALLQRAAKQRDIPNGIRVAPIVMLLVITLFSGAAYAHLQSRLEREPLTTWQAVLDASSDAYDELLFQGVVEGDEGEWVYTSRHVVAGEFRIVMDGGVALVTDPIVVGEPAGIGQHGLRGGSTVIVEGVRNEYDDGSSYFHRATIYARDIRGYRDWIAPERWLHLVGALLSLGAVVFFSFAWWVGRKRRDPQTF